MGVSNVSASNHQYISKSHHNTANSIQKNHSRKRQTSLRELVQPGFHCQPSELAQGKGTGLVVAGGKDHGSPFRAGLSPSDHVYVSLGNLQGFSKLSGALLHQFL